MAGIGLLALLDDIASILDDVAVLTKVAAKNTAGIMDDVSVLTKVAAKKTAGVLGDDLALNAQQVSGVSADRELPVIFSVFKGSLRNKVILVPAAIAVSAFLPQLITPLLMIGGAYLCFEGAEKVLHRFFGGHEASKEGARTEPAPEDEAVEFAVDEIPPLLSDATHSENALKERMPAESATINAATEGGATEHAAAENTFNAERAAAGNTIDAGNVTTGPAATASAAAEEKRKIRGAVRTDFILSAEIIVIALGTVPDDASLLLRATVLTVIGFGMTVGVYGLVACIVKLDDAGLLLLRRHPEGGFLKALGIFLLNLSPRLMRLLGVAGTVAMFLVGGGILAHGLPWLHTAMEAAAALPLSDLWSMLLNLGIGAATGGLLVALITPLSRRLRRSLQHT